MTNPIVQRTELHDVVSSVGTKLVTEDLAVGRRVCSERCLSAIGKSEFAELFCDSLPRPVALHVLFKSQLHDRKAENGSGPNHVDSRDVRHAELDRDRYLPLDVLGGATWVGRNDLHHLARDVWIRIDPLMQERIDSRRGDERC
jgi:hypothetical protein